MTSTRALRFFVAVWFAGVAVLHAQTFTQTRNTGARSNRVNVVFLAEGYTADQESKFQTDAATHLSVLLGDESWSRFPNYINAFTIFVASAESGADDPLAGITRDTYFNSTFNTQGIDRLLTVGSGASGTSKVFALLSQFIPEYDVVIVLVNSTKYGGAGGSFVTTSLNTSSREVLLHELGHSFAKLTDEYVDTAAAPFYAPAEFANATQKTTRDTIPWRDFIAASTVLPTTSASNENLVGLFLGAHYRSTGFYRPTNNSKMRSLDRPFGPVNLRAFATAFHALNLENATVRPSLVQSPAGALVAAGQGYTLQADASGAGPLTYQWRFNGTYLSTATSSSLALLGMNAAQAGIYSVEVTNARGTTTSADVAVLLPGTLATAGATVTPASASGASGQSASLNATVSGALWPNVQWRRNGEAVPGATSAAFTLTNLQPASAGLYTATSSLAAVTPPAIVGVSTASKVVGAGSEILSNQFVAFNNNTFDQVGLQGAAATITADAGQITRISFIDLSNDIVQVEFSGAGSLSLVLEGASGPALATNYNQPGVTYMKGHAGIVIVGADETTNVGVFSVGRFTAANANLFKSDVSYDGVADIAFIAIATTNGKFGGVRTANATYSNTLGLTGIYAPGVTFSGPVYLHNLSASGEATPVIILGGADDVRITGGDLQQANGRPVEVDGFSQLRLVDGTDSHQRAQAAQPLRTRLERNGVDLTAQLVSSGQ